MRFSVAALALAGLASAQVQTIVDTLNNVNTLVNNLDSAISAWSSGSPQPVIDASMKVIDATTKGTDTINALQMITVQDAVQVQKVVQTLQTNVDKAVTDLVGKKDQAKAANLGGEAYKQLQMQYNGAKGLSTAISSKVPTSVAVVATNLSNAILKSIQNGLDKYQDISTQVYPGQLTGTTASAGAAAGGASNSTASTGTSTGSTAGSNSTTPVTGKPTTAAGGAAAGNSTAAHSGAGSLQVAGGLSFAAAVAAVLAL